MANLPSQFPMDSSSHASQALHILLWPGLRAASMMEMKTLMVLYPTNIPHRNSQPCTSWLQQRGITMVLLPAWRVEAQMVVSGTCVDACCAWVRCTMWSTNVWTAWRMRQSLWRRWGWIPMMFHQFGGWTSIYPSSLWFSKHRIPWVFTARWRMIRTLWRMERPWNMWPSVGMETRVPWCWVRTGS